MSSACNRKLRPSLPAFSLAVVNETSDRCRDEEEVCNASACEPMSLIPEFPFLAIGSWRDAHVPAHQLCALGVTHILNVARECPFDCADTCSLTPPQNQGAQPYVVHKKCIPLDDNHSQNIECGFQEAFAFIDSAKASGGLCLIHCRRGMSRSPAIVIAYLIATAHMTYHEALELVSKYRHISLNLNFQQILETYQPHPNAHFACSAGVLDRQESDCGISESSNSRPSSIPNNSDNGLLHPVPHVHASTFSS